MKGIAYSDDFLMIKSDIDLVADHLKRAILTSPGERVHNNNYGSKFLEYLFHFEPVIRQDIVAEIKGIVKKVVPTDYEATNYIIESIFEEHKLILTFDLKNKRTNEVVRISQDFLREEE